MLIILIAMFGANVVADAGAENRYNSTAAGSSICMPPDYKFSEGAAKFERFHKDPLNVQLHLLTTPLGVIGLFGCLIKMSGGRVAPTLLLASAYAVSLPVFIDGALLLQTMSLLLGIVVLGCNLALLDWLPNILCLAAGFFGQDLAHLYTREATYMYTYLAKCSGAAFWAPLFMEHVYFLLPLCLSVATPSLRAVAAALPLMVAVWGNYALDNLGYHFPALVARSRVVSGKCTGKEEIEDMQLIRSWVRDQNLPTDVTKHWWPHKLPLAQETAFGRLARSESIKKAFATKFRGDRFEVGMVSGMNEVYVSTSNKKGSSDQVFFTKHIDGPWCLFPFCSVYRCILGIDANTEFQTHFHMHRQTFTLADGDFASFDFHREPHYISQDLAHRNEELRVVLKFHYVAYPRTLWFLGYLLSYMSVKYNQAFRALFLYTLQPKTAMQQLTSDWGVNLFTDIYHLLERYFGYSNAFYVLSAAALAWLANEPRIFLYSTSFVHYGRYILTYYVRRDVCFETFKRDVLIFKSIAMVQLALVYLWPYLTLPWGSYPVSPMSLAMIVAGYSVSFFATRALGVDVTYFGIELGVVDAPKHFVKVFPYSVLPHPMILGQVVALAGIHLAPQVRDPLPQLVPMHIAFYLLHMTQEHFDMHGQ